MPVIEEINARGEPEEHLELTATTRQLELGQEIVETRNAARMRKMITYAGIIEGLLGVLFLSNPLAFSLSMGYMATGGFLTAWGLALSPAARKHLLRPIRHELQDMLEIVRVKFGYAPVVPASLRDEERINDFFTDVVDNPSGQHRSLLYRVTRSITQAMPEDASANQLIKVINHLFTGKPLDEEMMKFMVPKTAELGAARESVAALFVNKLTPSEEILRIYNDGEERERYKRQMMVEDRRVIQFLLLSNLLLEVNRGVAGVDPDEFTAKFKTFCDEKFLPHCKRLHGERQVTQGTRALFEHVEGEVRFYENDRSGRAKEEADKAADDERAEEYCEEYRRKIAAAEMTAVAPHSAKDEKPVVDKAEYIAGDSIVPPSAIALQEAREFCRESQGRGKEE